MCLCEARGLDFLPSDCPLSSAERRGQLESERSKSSTKAPSRQDKEGPRPLPACPSSSTVCGWHPSAGSMRRRCQRLACTS